MDLLRAGDRRGPPRRPAAGDRRGQRGHREHGRHRPLDELADLCAREGLWFHADGAYGAMATISPRLRPLFAGLERADSVAADPHKWLYVPYEAGATLVREPGRLADAFRRPAEYLVHDRRQPGPRPGLSTSAGPSCRAASRPSRSGWA